MRKRWQFLSFLLSAAFTVGLAGEPSHPVPAAGGPPSLVLQMSPTSPVVIMFDRVEVEWRLENTGQKSEYVCQWPGIAFSQHWECPNGVLKAGAPGYPSSRRLERKYYIELKPGEALIGYGQVDVWPTPSGALSLSAEFRCDQDGREYGLSAWHGRISSAWVSVEVPKDAKAKACEP